MICSMNLVKRFLLLFILTLTSLALAGEELKKVGEYFIVGDDYNGTAISPDGKLAVVVETDKNVGIPVPKGTGESPYSAYLLEVDTEKELWKNKVDGDFSWGPLTSMVTARWSPNAKAFILRQQQGRLYSKTELYLKTRSGEWKKATVKPSDFEESDFFQKRYHKRLKEAKSWFDKKGSPNGPFPGARHYGDWFGKDIISVNVGLVGRLIYRYDEEANLQLIGLDLQEGFPY